MAESDPAEVALINLQNEERVSAAKMRQLFQADVYEEMKNHLEDCLGRNFYATVDQDMFPEQQHSFVFPLIRAFRDAHYVVAAFFLPRWSSEGGCGGSAVLHVVPPSFSSRDAERKYRVRYGTKYYNNWAMSRDALYQFVRNDAARILLNQAANLNLLSVGETVSWMPGTRAGRQEFESARQGYGHLNQLTVWSIRVSKPSAEMSIFFARGAKRYESQLIDWARFGTSKLCDAMALSVPHALRCRLLEEREKSQNPIGERFRTLPNNLDPLSQEAFEKKYEEAYRGLPEVVDTVQLEGYLRRDRAEIRRQQRLKESRPSSESRSSPRGRSSSDGDRTEVELERGRRSARNQPTTEICNVTSSVGAPLSSDIITPGTSRPLTTTASVNPMPSVFTTTSTKTTASHTISHTQVVPPTNATRVQFEDQASGSSQTITTDPSQSVFPATTQSANTEPAIIAAVPAQAKPNQDIRNDFGIGREDDEEEEVGQDQGEPAPQLLPVPQGARLPPTLPEGLREPPTIPLSPEICRLPTGSISTYLQPRYLPEQTQNVQATKSKPPILWGTKDQVNRSQRPVTTTVAPYVPPPANPAFYNPAQDINPVYVPTPIYTPSTTATEILNTLSQLQTFQTSQKKTNGSQIMQTPSVSRESSPPETGNPPNITPAAAKQQPDEVIQPYSPTSPAYEATNVSMDDLDYEPVDQHHSTPERQQHPKPRIEPVFSPEPGSSGMHSSSDEEQTKEELMKELGPKRFKRMVRMFQEEPKEFQYQFMKKERKQRKQNLPGATYKGDADREKR